MSAMGRKRTSAPPLQHSGEANSRSSVTHVPHQLPQVSPDIEAKGISRASHDVMAPWLAHGPGKWQHASSEDHAELSREKIEQCVNPKCIEDRRNRREYRIRCDVNNQDGCRYKEPAPSPAQMFPDEPAGGVGRRHLRMSAMGRKPTLSSPRPARPTRCPLSTRNSHWRLIRAGIIRPRTLRFAGSSRTSRRCRSHMARCKRTSAAATTPDGAPWQSAAAPRRRTAAVQARRPR